MSVTLHTCPSCSSVLTFRSRDTNLIVCHQCGIRLQRWDDGVLKEKPEIVRVQDTLTPIQLGTTGMWKEKKFTVIGRVRCVFEEDLASNWSIFFEDGRLLTMVESYGQFAVYEKIPPDPKLTFNKVIGLVVGSGAVVADSGKKYMLERKNKCSSIEVEGEAWIFDWNGEFESVEVACADGDRVEILDLEHRSFLYFRIHYQTFEDFNFKQLRALPVGAIAKTLTCVQCNKPNELRSFPLSQSFCCKHCGAALSYYQGQVKYRRRMKLDKTPAIPLNTKGVLKGIEYELVGFAEKEDSYGWSWREYTLFNPVRGYAFLSEYNGHWIFLQEKPDAPLIPNDSDSQIHFRGETFQLYNGYHYSITDARGEFPCDVFNDADPRAREFISPPEIWVREIQQQGFCWYHGEHIDGKELYTAFGNDISLPYRMGVGAVQPVKGYVSIQWLKRSMLGVIIFFFLLFCITLLFNRDEVVYSGTWYLPDSTTTHSVVTPKFRLDKRSSNLLLKLEAPVVNNWFEVNITLVNADDGKEYTLEEGVEYYSGYEGGDSWSEGSTSNDALFLSIPRGNYFLEVIASKPYGDSPAYYTLEARYDVPMWRNLLIFMLMALVPGFVVFLYIRNREKARWENSSFSPFATSINNDDEGS